jgi:hypothetical protein
MSGSELPGYRQRSTVSPLGDLVKDLMERRICPRQDAFTAVADVMSDLLPVEFRRHCRVDEIRGGQVKMVADSPSYLHELRLCSSELLKELQRRCPGTRIRSIRCTIGL